MRFYPFILASILIMALILSCSGATQPVSPDNSPTPGVIVTPQSGPGIPRDTSYLWGYYDVWFDFETETVQVAPNRAVEFSANVVKFLNGFPPGISFAFNGVTPGSGYVDVDLDVTITHPIDNVAYDGYDVRGIFIGDGSKVIDYGPQVTLADKNSEQVLLNADGYTRWFNPTEFTTPKIWGYIPGDFASHNYTGTATVNPCKYFGQGLGAVDDLWTYLNSGDTGVGYFLHGSSNTRNYLIRFPLPVPGTKFNYAVVANWAGTAPAMHPSHATEAVGLDLVDSSNLWYVDPSNKGGKLVLDITVFDWFSTLSAGVMDDYQIIIWSSVLSSQNYFDSSEMTPTASSDHTFTYHAEVLADNIQMLDRNEMIVIVESAVADYKNPAGVQNSAWDEPLAAFFRYNLSVSNVAPASIEVVTPNGGEQWDVGTTQDITWTSDGVAGTVFIEYSKDDFASDITTIATDETNDGSYQWTDIPCDISGGLKVRVSSTDDPQISDMSDNPFSIPNFGWAESYGLAGDDTANDIAVDQAGNVYIAGYVYSSTTDNDCVLLKYDSCGNLVWGKTWGGDYTDECYGVATDPDGYIYVTGYFDNDADFDPGPGDEHRTSNGGYDVFLSRFNTNGDLEWAVTFGGSNDDYGYAVASDIAFNIYVTGSFYDTVDFDPDTPVTECTSAGEADVFLAKYTHSPGTFHSVKTWGGTGYDEGLDVAIDGFNQALVAGYFTDTADFDPGAGTDNHTSNGGNDAFVSVINYGFEWQWAATWGGISNDDADTVAGSLQGGTYVAGNFQDTVDFDPGAGTDNHTSGGGYDSFLNVFDFSGSWQWAATWGGPESNTAYGIGVTLLGDIFISGAFRGTADFDPGPGTYPLDSNGNADVYFLRFNAMGEIQWARSWGDANYNEGSGLVLDNARNIFVLTSQFADPTDFAPTDPLCADSPDVHNSNGNMDFALSKFLPDGCW